MTDGRTVCRDASQFKLANAVINITDEPEKNEEVQTSQAVPDIETPGKGTPPSAPLDPPDTKANAEKPMEPPSAEIIPEQETEPEQEAEHNQPADRLAVMRATRERRQPSYLKDYVLPKGRDSRKQIVIFKKVTTFFNFEDMFRCYKHHRQLQNI